MTETTCSPSSRFRAARSTARSTASTTTRRSLLSLTAACVLACSAFTTPPLARRSDLSFVVVPRSTANDERTTTTTTSTTTTTDAPRRRPDARAPSKVDAGNNAVRASNLRDPRPGEGFNVVLTHCTADFDSLASAVGLAKLWSLPAEEDDGVGGGDGEEGGEETSEHEGADGASSSSSGEHVIDAESSMFALHNSRDEDLFERYHRFLAARERERGSDGRRVDGDRLGGDGGDDAVRPRDAAESSRPVQHDSDRPLPTYVVLPRGAHPSVQRFLALHKHLFPIKSLRSLPSEEASPLHRLGLVDAQRRDRVGPAEPLLDRARRVTVIDHHVDAESDIPEADEYVVDGTGSVTTLIVERLSRRDVSVTEAEATLLALGVHGDTGSLTFGSATARDARALAWTMERGASQTAIAAHARSPLDAEQQAALTQALLHTNTTTARGAAVSTVLLSAPRFVNGLAAVAQDALELSGSDVLLLAVVYDPRSDRRGRSKNKNKSNNNNNNNNKNNKNDRETRTATKAVFDTVLVNDESVHDTPSSSSSSSSFTSSSYYNDTASYESFMAEAWKGGEDALKRKRWRAAFDRRDDDRSGYLEKDEIESVLSSSGVLVSKDAVASVMETIDTDGDGRIDFDEFVEFAETCERAQRADEARTGRRPATMILIGRCREGVHVRSVNLHRLLQRFGGGGHPKAASATVRLEDEGDAPGVLDDLVRELVDTSLSRQPVVGDFMTAPVLSAAPDMNEGQVENLFRRYDVRALPVVDDNEDVVGLVTYKEVLAAKQRSWNKEQRRRRLEEEEERRDVADADASSEQQQQQQRTPRRRRPRPEGSALKGWMKQHVAVVEVGATMSEVEAMLLENDVGCIPVVADGTRRLVGMVTRTDLLRQHRYYPSLHYHNKGFSDSIADRRPLTELRKYLKRHDKD